MKLINYYQQGNVIDPEANPFLSRAEELPPMQINTYHQPQPNLKPRVTVVPTPTKTFGQQFQEARAIALAGGPKTFMWKGKEIGTQLQGEVSGTQQLKNKVQQNQVKSKIQTQQGTAKVVPQISTTPEGKMLNNIIGYRQPLTKQPATMPQKTKANTVLPAQKLAKFTPGPNWKPYQENILPQLNPNVKSRFETQVNRQLAVK